jgi:hypothetical protein
MAELQKELQEGTAGDRNQIKDPLDPFCNPAMLQSCNFVWRR